MRDLSVIIVDDAEVARRAVARALGQASGIEVAGTAADGPAALERIEADPPDAVVLDVEMPGMDGLEVLRRIRAGHPAVKVVMFSALTERGAAVTLEALALGASDYVTKGDLERSAADLAARIRAICDPSIPDKILVRAPTRTPAEVVGIAGSTGGPEAIARLLGALPADLEAPVLVVQHLPREFSRAFVARLDRETPLKVRLAEPDRPLEKGVVDVAPGDAHLGVLGGGARARTVLHGGAAVHGWRPSANVLFRALARAFGARALAVVLTGMGKDGLDGAATVHAHGGRVFAQDHESSVVWGMPGLVVADGYAEKILPPRKLAREIALAVNAPVGVEA